MHPGSRQQLEHQRHLAERGAVEMPDAARPEGAQHTRLGIALDGIKHITRETVDKALRRPGDRGRAQAQQRVGRTRSGNDVVDQRKDNPPGEAGRDEAGVCHRTILRTRRRQTAPRR
jgi:hypothetical protein